ncbi:hypothetical protein, conserved [Leishmania tarentolae]|uniref:Uncharacterized protein n=1 Tax=Leishmania tarentolae TaxID=5689 RepID=A0A640KVM1_LEITA|nr:hypothetical protein, conserved [Leishmania tarentolae]
MKVNIKAVSHALDSILAAEKFPLEKAHSPSVPRQALLSSKSIPVEAPEISLLNSASGAWGEIVPVIESSASGIKPAQRVQSFPNDGQEKKSLTTKTERKGRSPKITTLHAPQNSKLNGSVKKAGTALADLLEYLKNAELVAFKVVEATGVDVASALPTPKNIGQWISQSRLPSKSWVTSTSLSHKACVLFELEDRLDMQKRREFLSAVPSSRGGLLAEGNTCTYVVQDFVAALVVETAAERQSIHLNSSDIADQERQIFNVSIETSSCRSGEFVTAASTSATPGTLTSLKIPGTLLNTFVRITISLPWSGPGTELIKVRAVCFFRSDSWTAEKVAPVQRSHSSLKGEVQGILQANGKGSPQDPQSVSEAVQEKDVEKTERTQPVQLSLRKREHEINDEGVAPFALSEHNIDADVADFVKAVALARSRQDSAIRKLSTFHGRCTVEYDWLLDTLVDASIEKHDSSGKASIPKADTEAPVLEYVHTIQAWNKAPALSVDAAVAYCLSETTSFSVSTIFATGLFSHEAQNHLSQPFKLHFFVVSPSDGIGQSSEQAYSPGVCLPPVHLLSGIASQAALLGCTTELLFTCPTNNGFGCALRTHNCASGAKDAHCKLIFVVPAQSSRVMNEDGVTGVTKCLLCTSLSIFCEPFDKRGIRLSQGCPFYSQSTFQCAKPCGALRLLIDGTRSFDALLPVLVEWAKVSGILRYYGSASQRTLQLLFFPSWLMKSDEVEESGVFSEPRHEAQWAGLNLRLSALWKKNTNEVDSVADDIVGLEAEYHCPATYVWQSRRGALRLVLTDAHFMEYLSCVDGFVAPSPLVSLATSYYGKEVEGALPTLPLTTLCEAPWMTLLEAAERLRKKSTTPVAALGKDVYADFYALRHRVTVSFAFHILSTAFKRGWARVSAAIPLCEGRIRDATLEFQNAHGPPLGEEVNGGNGMCGALGVLDEDAFMDTLFQWQYPFPNVVVLHCTNVLSAARPIPAPTSTPTVCASSSGVGEGVLSLFSEEVLRFFIPVSKVDEALS